jgi:hypothetical protein
MDVWNRLGKLGKGTLDWVGDVALGVTSLFGVKFAWDVSTALFNDREEFNGFYNTIRQAGIDTAKNVGRPIGGIIAAADKTAQNLLREPLSAAFLFAGQREDGFKKAWEARNQISFGQSALTAISQPLSFLPDSITAEFLDSDFDIYDEQKRKEAFERSVFGKYMSGTLDTVAQFAGDPLLLVGKAVKVIRSTDDAWDAIQGIRKARAGEENVYTKLAEDFANNDNIWASAHPWVKATNNETDVSYLLGQTNTKEEALDTMLAILGDDSGIKRLEELRRPDLAAPLRIANGELDRSSLNILLEEETAFAATQGKDMLSLLMRTPDEIAADRAYVQAWAQHDRYFAQLIRISEEAPATRGVGLGDVTTGRFKATSRTVRYYDRDYGDANVTSYQPTPFHRLYSTVSWNQIERPQGMVNLNDGESIREVTATVNRLVEKGLMGSDEAAGYMTRYAAGASPEARGAVVNELEQRGYRLLAAKHGYSLEDAENLFNLHVSARSGMMRQIKEEGFLWDAIENRMIKVPLLESQTANFLPVANFDEIDRVLGASKSTFRAAGSEAMRLQEFTSDLWKASVLLRLGYPVRNVVDSQLRILSTVGAMASLRYLGPGARNLMTNSRDSIKNSRLIDRFSLVDKPNANSVRVGIQSLGREIAEREKGLKKLDADLARDPGNPDIISRIAALSEELKTKLAVYDGQNRYLSEIEKAAIPTKKIRVGEETLDIASPIYGIDGVSYRVNGSFGGPNGGIFRDLSSSDKSFKALLRDYNALYSSASMSKSRGAVLPTDPQYYQSWVKAINEDFMNSAVSRRLIAGERIEDVAKWLEGEAGLRSRLGLARTDTMEYVGTVKQFVDNYIPDGYGIREQVLFGGPTGGSANITEEFLRNAIKDPDKLPVVHGHLIDNNLNLRDKNIIQQAINNGFKWLATMPEDALARHPLFIDLYKKSIARRIATIEQLKGKSIPRGEFEAIQFALEKSARADALKGVKATVYNIERRTNAAHFLRFAMPFFSAQENALKVWLKILGDKPQILYRAGVVWNAPNRGGLVVDENGEIVPPMQEYNPDDTMWLQVPEVFKKLPLIGEGLSSLDQIGISKRSLDVVFQGNPFGVNLGPLRAIPVANLMKLKPELSEVVGFIFPFGPDASIKQLAPGYLRRIWEKTEGQNNSDYAKMFQLIWLTEQQKAREEMRPYLSEKEIVKKVDAYYNMRTAAAIILPFSPRFDSPYRYYMNKWRQYSDEYGLGADAKFIDDYPDFFSFATTLSKNSTGSRATMTDVQNAKRYDRLIEDVSGDDKSLIGLITRGSGGAKYNPTAYWWQSETSISPGTPEKFRGKQTPIEAARANQAREGWAKYRKANALLDYELGKRGLTSYEQSGAEDLKNLRNAVIQSLSSDIDPVTGEPTGEPSAWYQDWRDTDGLKTAKTMIGLRKIVNNKEFMTDNADDPTWKSVALYLNIRDRFARNLMAREVSNINAKSNLDLRIMFDFYVNQLKLGDVEFADIYERYLSRDMIFDKYLDSGM